MAESAYEAPSLSPAKLIPLTITLAVGVINILIWVGVGSVWWNIIGLMRM